MFFDDTREFNNRVLLMCLTAKEIGGRVLGKSRNVRRTNNFLWLGTGNNTAIGSEMDRRCCHIRLNAKTVDIQKRTYRHPNFVEFLLQNRETAVRHILTMVEYWLSIGAPRFTDRKRASFEDWSEKVGGVLQVCGIEGFLDTRATIVQDSDEAAVKMFVRDWMKKHIGRKTTPGQLFEDALNAEMEVLSGNNEDQKKSRFMRMMPTLDGRVYVIEGVEYMIRSGYDNDENIAYYIERVKHDGP